MLGRRSLRWVAGPILITFIFAGLIIQTAASSPGLVTGDGKWQWVNPDIQGNTISAVSFVDENIGWGVGIGGTVIKTTDSGVSWTAQMPSTTCRGVVGNGCNLNGVSFINSLEGWAAGDSGTIWHTVDGGISWTSQTAALPAAGCNGSCQGVNLNDVHFIASSYGIAVATGYAFGTVDGGATWSVMPLGTGEYIKSVQVLDVSTAVAVGNGGIVYRFTRPGGAWSAGKVAGVPSGADLRSVYFIDSLHGFSVGYSYSSAFLWRTSDGGITWQQGAIPAIGRANGVAVAGDSLLVSGGQGQGAIFKRTSAGNWTDPIATVASGLTATSAGTTSLLMDVTFAGGSTVGFASGNAGAIVRTYDGGSNWSLTAGGNDVSFSDSSFINETTGWIVAQNGSVLRTDDAGANWSSDSSGIPANTNLTAVHFLDANTGFAAGYFGARGVAYKYSGGNWSAIALPGGVGSIWDIRMTDANHGWMVGIPGTGATTGIALRTSDGSTWTNTATGIGADIQLYGVDSTNAAANGWAAGQRTGGRAVLARFDPAGGGSWTTMEKTGPLFFTSLDMVNPTTGYAAGYISGPPEAGVGYKTTDGGASWNPVSMVTSKLMADVSFLDENTGYVAGQDGRVMKTADGGATWTHESPGTNVGFNSIEVVPSSNAPSGYSVIVSGASAAVLRTQVSPAGKPALTLTHNRGNGSYWGSYADYSQRLLTVEFSVTNTGPGAAYSVRLTGSTTNNGVACQTGMPLALNSVFPGDNVVLRLKYSIPAGTGGFNASIFATARDSQDNSYTYP